MSGGARLWSRPGAALVGLLLAYYLVPLDLDDSARVLVPSVVATAAGLGVVCWMMVKELAALRRGDRVRSTVALAMLLLLLVVAFSLTFYVLEQASPGQVPALRTRTDALYFVLSTMATVGYGDVHAEGQAARALVCAVIVFDVVVVASVLRAHTTQRAPRN